MPVKKEAAAKKETVKKAAAKPAVKKAAPAQAAAVKAPAAKKEVKKPDLREFLGEIEKRAYEVYLERKKAGNDGNEMSDWLVAEKEIKAKYKI